MPGRGGLQNTRSTWNGMDVGVVRFAEGIQAAS